MTLFLNAHADRLAPGSFQKPVDIPESQPGSPDLVTVCFNKDWLPVVLGSLFQLTLSTTWKSSSKTELLDGLQKANDLILIFQLAKTGCATIDTGPQGIGGDEMCCCLRMQDGILQILSCGVWTDVPGWSKSEIAPGQPGVGAPQPPSGDCQIYQGKITPTGAWLIPTPVNAGDTIEISNLIGSWSPSAFVEIWLCPDGNGYFAGNCIDHTASFDTGAPMPSAPLNGTIIFDGTNYYDVSLAANLDTPVTITILPGVTNAQALVRCNFHGGIDPAGEVTFTAKVCNNHAASWSHTFDFTLNSYGFQPALSGGVTPDAEYVIGTGWRNTANGFDELRIWIDSLPSTSYSAVKAVANLANAATEYAAGAGNAGSITIEFPTITPVGPGSGVISTEVATPYTATSFRIDIADTGHNVAGDIVLTSLTVSGTGADPFGGP